MLATFVKKLSPYSYRSYARSPGRLSGWFSRYQVYWNPDIISMKSIDFSIRLHQFVIVKLRIAYSLASINLSPLPSTYPQPWSAEKKGSFVFFCLFTFLFFFISSLSFAFEIREAERTRFCIAITSRHKNDRGCCHSSSPWSQSRFQRSRASWASFRESRPRCGRLFLVHETDPDRREAHSRARLVTSSNRYVDRYFNEFKVWSPRDRGQNG